MEIGRGHCHIAQARDTEHVEVVGILRDVEATLVNGVAPCRFPIVFYHAKLPVHPAADPDAVVARDTTGVDEPFPDGDVVRAVRLKVHVYVYWVLCGSEREAFHKALPLNFRSRISCL